jgi:hypothetical protein
VTARSDDMAGKKKKPITFTVMMPTADGWKQWEQGNDEELQAWREKIRRDVSKVLSEMCRRK